MRPSEYKKAAYPSVTVENVDVVTGVQVIDGTLAIDFESV